MDRPPTCKSTDRLDDIQYGVVLRGWTQRSELQPLSEGVTYVAYFTGCGAIGGVAFKIVRGGIVYRQGSGDAPVHEVEALR